MKLKVVNDTKKSVKRANILFPARSEKTVEIPSHKYLVVASCTKLEVEEITEENEEVEENNNEEENQRQAEEPDKETVETTEDTDISKEEDNVEPENTENNNNEEQEYTEELLKSYTVGELKEIARDMDATYDNDKEQFVRDILQELEGE